MMLAPPRLQRESAQRFQSARQQTISRDLPETPKPFGAIPAHR